MGCHLLIPAAGSGKRMGSEWLRQGKAQRNKLLMELLGKPILQWTLEAAIATTAIDWIGVVGQPCDREDFQQIFAKLDCAKPISWIQGGATRQESVFNGLRSLPNEANRVLVHDGARCLGTPELLERCVAALDNCLGFIAAVPVKDTIKIVEAGVVTDTPNREYLWAAQTPQGFIVDKLIAAHEQAEAQGWEVTDDAALFEKVGLPVQIVMGEETNLKITTPQDLAIAEFILTSR
jgi:2-C-methyl-D-erythritol 4-phosphate cytidylyltransferase